MEGVCHGAGEVRDQDKGTPTYFRYPIEQSGGQNIHPGSDHAVLYSLQRTTGRSCDFQTYTDTEVSFFLRFIIELSILKPKNRIKMFDRF